LLCGGRAAPSRGALEAGRREEMLALPQVWVGPRWNRHSCLFAACRPTGREAYSTCSALKLGEGKEEMLLTRLFASIGEWLDGASPEWARRRPTRPPHSPSA